MLSFNNWVQGGRIEKYLSGLKRFKNLGYYFSNLLPIFHLVASYCSIVFMFDVVLNGTLLHFVVIARNRLN